jgi:hypothetical protein
MPIESMKSSSDVKDGLSHPRESGRATTVVLAALALAAGGGLVLALLHVDTPEGAEHGAERNADGSWPTVAIGDAEQNGRRSSATSTPKPAANKQTPLDERFASKREPNLILPAPSVTNGAEPSSPDHSSGAERTSTKTTRDIKKKRSHDQRQADILRQLLSELASKVSLEEVSLEEASEPLATDDLYDKPFLEDRDDNWGYDELPPRFANQAGLEEGFLVVGFDGEFIHGSEMLEQMASGPNPPDPVAIDVWNPLTGEIATVMLPLDSLDFSAPPE